MSANISDFVQEFVTRITPITANRLGATVTTHALGRLLSPTAIQNEIFLPIEGFVSEYFAASGFESDLAKVRVWDSFLKVMPDAYAQVTGETEISEAISLILDSKDDFTALHSRSDYHYVVQPLEVAVSKVAAVRKTIARRLDASIQPTFIPLASAKDWIDTIRIIATMDEKDLLSRAHQAGLTAQGHHLLVQPLFKEVDAAITAENERLEEAGKASLTDLLAREFSSQSSSPAVIESSALTGEISRTVMWPALLARLETFIPSARGLTDMRVAAELDATSHLILDTSVNIKKVVEDAKKGSTNTGLSALYSEAKSAGETGAYPAYRANHELARVLHALAYSGDETTLGSDASNTLNIKRFGAAVPFSLSVLSVVANRRYKTAWKVLLLPAYNFSFIDTLVAFAKMSKGAGRVPVDKLRRALMKALKFDLRELILEQRNVLDARDVSGLNDEVMKQEKKLISYSEHFATQHPECRLTAHTTYKDFSAAAGMVHESTRPLGKVILPSTPETGFAESILVRDAHSFGSVVDSDSVSSVARLYNASYGSERLDDYTVHTSCSIFEAIARMCDDAEQGLRRKGDKSVVSLMASELIGDSVFEPIDDYHVFVYDKNENATVLLNGGLGRTGLTTHSFGNALESFTIGMAKGQSNPVDRKFERDIAINLGESIVRMLSSYVPHVIEINKKEDIQVDFKEENGKYVKRINSLDNLFVHVDMTTKFLYRLASSPLVPDSLKEMIDSERLHALTHQSYYIRKDMNAIVRFLAHDLAERLAASSSPRTMEVVAKVFTSPLSIEDRTYLDDKVNLGYVKGAFISASGVTAALGKNSPVSVMFIRHFVSAVKSGLVRNSDRD